jgi:hypothetical protein
MDRASHHLAGLTTGLALAAVYPAPLPVKAGIIAVATLTAGGGWSPDIDQTRMWGFLDRILPDEWLGEQGPMRHRGVSHFWGIPVTFAVLTYLYAPPAWSWAAYAAAAGWLSHLAGDWVYGAAGYGRGPGIPLAPWWHHRGLGCRSGGHGEHVIARPILVLLAVYLAAGLVVPGLPYQPHPIHLHPPALPRFVARAPSSHVLTCQY